MQEKPLTPYQKTQLAAATFLGLIVTAAAGAAFMLRPRAAAAPLEPAPLRDAVASRPAPAPFDADLQRERLLAAASGASVARVETLRRQGASWSAIARRLGWPARSASLFAKTGVLVGQRLARR